MADKPDGKYIKVRWKHSFLDEPVLLDSELNDDRWGEGGLIMDSKAGRAYLKYDDFLPHVKDVVTANWPGPCQSCGCRALPCEMRAYEDHGRLYFEGVCPLCGKNLALPYDEMD